MRFGGVRILRSVDSISHDDDYDDDIDMDDGDDDHDDSANTAAETVQLDPGVEYLRHSLHVFSLRTGQFVQSVPDLPVLFEGIQEDPGMTVSQVHTNERFIVVSAVDTRTNVPSLHVYDASTLRKRSTLKDVYPSPKTGMPVVALGDRWMAYASTKDPPIHVGSNFGGVSAASPPVTPTVAESSGRVRTYSENQSAVSTQVKDLVKDYSGRVFKEARRLLEHGIESIGEYVTGEKAIRSPLDTVQDPWIMWHARNPSLSQAPIGAIRVVDLEQVGASLSSESTNEPRTVVHFQPHHHHLHQLQFHPNGTMLASVSVEGHTVHVWELEPPLLPSGPQILGAAAADTYLNAATVVRHRFQLERGISPAHVQELSWSACGGWLSATTKRGTVHCWKLPEADEIAAALYPSACVTVPSSIAKVRVPIASWGKGSVDLSQMQTPWNEEADEETDEDQPMMNGIGILHRSILLSPDPTASNTSVAQDRRLFESNHLSAVELDTQKTKIVRIWRRFGTMRARFMAEQQGKEGSSSIRDMLIINPRGPHPSLKMSPWLARYPALTSEMHVALVFSTVATLSLHRIYLSDAEHRTVKDSAAWTVGRDVHDAFTGLDAVGHLPEPWPTVRTLMQPAFVATGAAGIEDDNATVPWPSEVETQTYLAADSNPLALRSSSVGSGEHGLPLTQDMYRPIWNGPQYSFYQRPEGNDENAGKPLCEAAEVSDNLTQDLPAAMDDVVIKEDDS